MKRQELKVRVPEFRISIEDFLGQFTLIVGEINTGKTTLTENILETYCRTKGGRVVVVDLAPDISISHLHLVNPKTVSLGGGGDSRPTFAKIGGTIRIASSCDAKYFHGHIHAPRLTARNEEEAEAMARENAITIEAMFEKALEEEADALFVNDCTLYLHSGDAVKMLEWIRSTKTAVVNGYEGLSLGEGKLSRREREGLAFLKENCDLLIELQPLASRTSSIPFDSGPWG